MEEQYYSDKAITPAFILCCIGFIGFAGLHRFYVGKVWTGILFLLTGGLLFFGTGFDTVAMIMGGFKDKQGRIVEPWRARSR